jgi:hypothetical protein
MKALLGIAMLVSLWPVPAVALVFSSGSADSGSNTREASRESTRDSGGNSPPQPPKIQPRAVARDALVPTIRAGDRVVADFEKVQLVEGQPIPGIPQRADRVAAQLSSWERDLGPLATPYDRRAASTLRNLLVALSDLAASPNQSTLDAYNSALGPYNASIP